MSKVIAVLISDVHYNINTVKLADTVMRQAIKRANAHQVPLIIAGDLHDTKANLRGECVSAMIETIKLAKIKPIILVGNHDLINEKDITKHSLEFLEPYAHIQTKCGSWKNYTLIAYHSDVQKLKEFLKTLPKGSNIIMHQGLQDTHMGDYIQDKSALVKEDVADHMVISGHYHHRQIIECGPTGENFIGSFRYIGNPYTLSWGEANDPMKGFQVLYDNNNTTFVSTNVRKHVIVSTTSELSIEGSFNADDLVWVKVTDTRENLARLTRKDVAKALVRDVFKVTHHPLDIRQDEKENVCQNNTNVRQTRTYVDILDSIISNLNNTSEEGKERLKSMWKSMV